MSAERKVRAWSDGLSRILKVTKGRDTTTYVWRVLTETWHVAERERRLMDSDVEQPESTALAWQAAAEGGAA